MATLESMFERVWDEIPSVTEGIALRALSDSAKEFCRRSHAWRGPVEAVPLLDGFRYKLVTPPGTVVVSLLSVRVGAVPRWLEPVAPFDARLLSQDSTPSVYTQWSPNEIEFDALNAEPITVLAALALAQGATSTEIPDALADEYGEAIAAGAKMRLVRMTGNEWSNPAAAPGYAATYYTAITEAKRRMTNALDQAELRIEMRPWL